MISFRFMISDHIAIICDKDVLIYVFSYFRCRCVDREGLRIQQYHRFDKGESDCGKCLVSSIRMIKISVEYYHTQLRYIIYSHKFKYLKILYRILPQYLAQKLPFSKVLF